MSDPPVAGGAGPGSLPGFRTDIELFSVAGHDGIIREVNGRFERMLGLDAHAAEGRSLLEFVHPEDITRVVAGLSALESGTDEVLVENRFLAGDGSVVHLEWVARTAAGTDLWWAAARDVTAFHTAVAAGTDLRTRLHLAIGTALAAMWDLDVRTGTLHWEEEAAELLGVDPDDVPGTVLALTALARPDEQGTLHAAFSLLPTGADGLDIEFAIGAEQSTRFVRLRGKVVERDRRGRGTRAIGLVVDMSAEKAMQEQMLVLLMSDPLTGVANRRAFDQTLRAQWRRCTRAGLPISMAMVDLDDFKRLNDTYGHLVGDDVLCAVGRALGAHSRPDIDLLGRFGGEEFAIVLPEADAGVAAEVASRLVDAVRGLRLRQLPDRRITASIGTATWLPGDPAIKSAELVRRADEALYAAKAAGKDRARHYLARPAAGYATAADPAGSGKAGRP